MSAPEAGMMTARRFHDIVGRLPAPPGNTVEQVRRVFLACCLTWSVFGLFIVAVHTDGPAFAAVVGGTAGLATWWCVGYRRRGYPGWAWPAESVLVTAVVVVSDFDATVVLLFLWASYRILYGGRVLRLVGAACVIASLTTAGLLTGHGASLLTAVPTAVMALLVLHVLVETAQARDDAVSGGK